MLRRPPSRRWHGLRPRSLRRLRRKYATAKYSPVVHLRSLLPMSSLWQAMQSAVGIGSVLAGFRLESLIGEGAMGSVYLAEDTKRGGPVALKLLVPQLARDESFRRRFLRESQLAASLDHPHVVPIVAAGEEDGVLYLAMRHIEGSDLRELLRREGTLEPERALDLLAEVAGALDTAHAAGLVHRDVKPGNILLTEDTGDEHTYVCDFGLARHVSSASSLTTDRGLIGTIDYIPPEQIEGGSIDGRADVYSLGCVLFECLAGARPFDRESELSVVFAHLNEPPPRLSDLRPDLPGAFDDVFATALAKSPADRYSDLRRADRGGPRRAARTICLRRRAGRRRLLLRPGSRCVAAAGAAIGGVLLETEASPRRPTGDHADIDRRRDARAHRRAYKQSVRRLASRDALRSRTSLRSRSAGPRWRSTSRPRDEANIITPGTRTTGPRMGSGHARPSRSSRRRTAGASTVESATSPDGKKVHPYARRQEPALRARQRPQGGAVGCALRRGSTDGARARWLGGVRELRRRGIETPLHLTASWVRARSTR